MNNIIMSKNIQNIPSFQYEWNIVHITTHSKYTFSLQYFPWKRSSVTLTETVPNLQHRYQYLINLIYKYTHEINKKSIMNKNDMK